MDYSPVTIGGSDAAQSPQNVGAVADTALEGSSKSSPPSPSTSCFEDPGDADGTPGTFSASKKNAPVSAPVGRKKAKKMVQEAYVGNKKRILEESIAVSMANKADDALTHNDRLVESNALLAHRSMGDVETKEDVEARLYFIRLKQNIHLKEAEAKLAELEKSTKPLKSSASQVNRVLESSYDDNNDSDDYDEDEQHDDRGF